MSSELTSETAFILSRYIFKGDNYINNDITLEDVVKIISTIDVKQQVKTKKRTDRTIITDKQLRTETAA